MSLSFSESLANSIENATATMAVEEINMDDVSAEMPTVRAYSLRSVAALSDSDNWTAITDKDYRFYNNEYRDDNYSSVDEQKNIVLDPSQFNITQEQNSQYIPFKMLRYYDGFDLKDTKLSIYYVNKNKDFHADVPVDVYYNDEYIKFAWLVSEFATQVAGILQFEIHADGFNSKNEPYTWKSRPIDKLNVLQSLEDVAVGEIGLSEEEIENWYNKIQFESQKAQSAAANAQASADEATRLVNALQDGITQEVEIAVNNTVGTVVDAKVSEKLANYYTKVETYNRDEIDDKIESVKPDGYATIAYVDEQIGDIGESENVVSYLSNKFGNLVDDDNNSLTVEAYVNKKVEEVDVSEQIGNLGTDDDGNPITNVVDYVDKKIGDVDVSEQLTNYYTKEETYDKNTIDTKLQNVSVDLTGYAKESYVDNKVNESKTSFNSTITEIRDEIASIDKTPNAYYVTTYNEPYTLEGTEYTGENTLVLYRTDETDSEGARSVVSSHVITGGSGGSVSSNIIKIERETASPYVATFGSAIKIDYKFIGTDSNGEDIEMGYATWKIGNKTVINKEPIYTSVHMPDGINSVDLTKYIGKGSDQKVTLIINDDIGTVQQKIWYVSVIDVELISNFDDTKYYTANTPVEFTFTPYGAVDKTVHFLLNGKEIGTKFSGKSSIGLLDAYTIPAQEHGSYLLEVYMTAEINGSTIESNHVLKDILWFDNTSNVPVIGTTYQNFTARQYDTTNIEYTVYDPSTDNPMVEIAVDEVVVSNPTLEKATNIYTFKTDVVGEHTITITCGETVKTIKVNVTELNIDVSPVTTGLAFDFNPYGKSNNDTDRLWTNGTTSMSVSDNFDWVNGGYQYDENGDQYFCVKSGTTATIDYNLFADDAKTQGKEFKVVFKTTNIKNRDTTFISCMNSGIGLDMKVQDANIFSSNGNLYSPYCEEDIIEFEFNINTTDSIPLVMTYEDGVGCRPMIYTSDASFWQSTPQPIIIGSNDCDVHIYRMKAYTRSLSDSEILSNFILDARNADEMVDRYNRNQIYENKEGVKVLTPEGLAEACPDLRVIIVDAPWFTNDKDNKVDDTTITMIYKNGRPEDNWTCTGARHSGQGTSSNEYGYAGRNIDLIMNDEISLFKWTNENGQEVESKTITLTETSVPTNYLNVKVNIASSENQNNAQFARRYNEYNPFVRSAKFNDSKVKDCMEFYNCVIFVRERNEDISTHREFQDCETHFYAIGNVGDSKKTDASRVNDKNDPKEFVVEITDYNVKLAEFPTGNGNDVCALSDWKTGNAAYDYLYAEYKYKDGKFKSFGSESYEFRYEMKGITEEQREANINAWRDMYKFVVTSTNEDFYNRLKEYFVVDSALYYYLFTERYTMVDNRAKNSFWHYGKVYITTDEAMALGDKAGGFIVDNEQAAINDGYRFDLTFFYDADTALGIDNTGKLVLPYGKEDTDYYVDDDPSSTYVYRAAESTFFCRIRDLFGSELQAMFVDRESKNAWSANSLITQWDNYQNQFPEELWRLDIQRKYLRTYLGTSIDNSIAGAKEAIFLPQMMNGRKKYQRRMFERNQELYMATKYFGTTATQDQIRVRFNNPESYVVKPDFALHITPYSDMYIGVSFYNGHKDNFRAKAGIEYQINYPEGLDTADITLIYGASFIQAIGDLSKCYIGDNDFTKATRLQSLVIGSNIEGYANSYMTEIKLANNKLLEYLDVRNVTGLSSTIDLSQCGNMLELRAEGSGAKGVIFANGGKIQKFYLPSITSLTAKNLNYIEDFNIESYINLQTLVVENTAAIDTHEIVDDTLEEQSALSEGSAKLNVVRLKGIDWDIENTDILSEIYLLRGQDDDGGEIPQSVLAGAITVPTIGQYELLKYQEAWSKYGLSIIPKDGIIPQYKVTFKNHDGTDLDVQYVDQYGDAVDPTTREDNPIEIPTKKSTMQYSYTFSGWDKSFENIVMDIDVYAIYTESLRDYTIRYVLPSSMDGGAVLKTATGKYGDNIVYDGITPTYTKAEPTVFYLFNRWDKSGFLIDGIDEKTGVKTVTAIFDRFSDNSTYFNGKELADLSPVEIYAMNKLGMAEAVITDKDQYTITVGNDVDYDDIESELLISEKTYFNGKDTHIDTGIKLFDEDKDFILAIDYEFLTGCESGSTLVQCYQSNTNQGFNLVYDGNAQLVWGTSSNNVAGINNREMIVLRHRKGSHNLTVYKSNLDGDSVLTTELTKKQATVTNATLIFGASSPEENYYENYAVGNINWAKIWYKDLGDEVCRNLAMWTHESITMEACGLRRYYLMDDLNNVTSQRCSFSLLASHLLSRTKKWNISNTNVGGWADSELNHSLNTRLYNAMPLQIKSLMKRMAVRSSSGNMSEDITTSGCYITVPALIELDSAYGNTSSYSAAYGNEINAVTGVNKTISYLSDNTSRKRAFDGGDYYGYWTRSPNVAYQNYIWRIDENGVAQGITNASGHNGYPLGVLIEISF